MVVNAISFLSLRRACAAALVVTGLFHAMPAASAQISSGTAAPAWTLRDLSGKFVKSDEFKGKVVIVDFWATWCPPCRAEIPGFVGLYKRYGDKGLVIVGVSLDQQGAAVVKSFVEKFGVNYPIVMGDAKIAEAFGGVEALPTTFVIDRQGRVVRTHVGFADAETFEKDIKPLL